MYESFKTNTHMALLYNVTDLSALKYPGDSQLHHFRHQWDLITQSMTDTVGQDTLATVLLTKIENSNELREHCLLPPVRYRACRPLVPLPP